MKRRNFLLTATALVGAAPFWVQGASGQTAENQVIEMSLGADDAPVTIIEYGSFTCPHCATFHKEFFEPLKTDYIDTGKVRFIYHELVRNRVDIWVGMLARCDAGPERYFPMNALFFENQSTWLASNDPVVIVEELRKLARVSGMDETQLEACLTDAELAQQILNTSEANADANDITATPTVFLDGERLELSTYADLKAQIDAKLPAE